VNLASLGRLIREKVVEKLDHRNINLEVPFMSGRLASTENLAVAIWEELEEEIRKLGGILHSVRINETENNSAEYLGPEPEKE
jgi:6-pyruvoyltetrahydropterin/6-carboxytetrahydropterin synthase